MQQTSINVNVFMVTPLASVITFPSDSQCMQHEVVLYCEHGDWLCLWQCISVNA
jgi:hypothetical protein